MERNGRRNKIEWIGPKKLLFFDREGLRDTCHEQMHAARVSRRGALMRGPTPAEVPLPDLVLRLAFAGTRQTRDCGPTLKGAIAELLERFAARLGEQWAERASNLGRYYSDVKPRLRLVTGLAEGADAIVVQAFGDLQPPDIVALELAAVLPCDSKSYRESRNAEFRPEFDKYRDSCAYVVEGDGLLPTGDTPYAKRCRARAYRLQATLLLRQADVLIAAFNPEQEGGVGGTVETIQAALSLHLPVVLINATSNAIVFLDRSADMPVDWSLFRGPLAEVGTWLEPLIDEIVGGPRDPHTSDLIEIYFDTSTSLRTRRSDHFLGAFWRLFQNAMAEEGKQKLSAAEEPEGPLTRWRHRARNLTYDNGNRYRGVFLLNYTLAIVAVGLATATLGLFAWGGVGHEFVVSIGIVKLSVLILMLVIADRANKSHWSARAAAYRYLAERLRTMHYLPALGNFGPVIANRSLSSVASHQRSSIDWLFAAQVRSQSPALYAADASASGTAFVRISSGSALERIEIDLLGDATSGQIGYHQRNEFRMGAMNSKTERWVTGMVWGVIAAVVLDLVVGFVSHHAAILLVEIAAVLPAAVASFHGIRFQSECERLADRSAAMAQLLKGHVARAREIRNDIESRNSQASGSDRMVGSGGVEALRHAERIASDMLAEVDEWSVLYAKHVAHA